MAARQFRPAHDTWPHPLVVALFALVLVGSSGGAPTPVVMGYIYSGTAASLVNYQALVDGVLNAKLNSTYTFTLKQLNPDPTIGPPQVPAGTVDMFTATRPGGGVDLIAGNVAYFECCAAVTGVEPIATAVFVDSYTGAALELDGGLVLAAAGRSDLNVLRDIAGQTVAIPNPLTNWHSVTAQWLQLLLDNPGLTAADFWQLPAQVQVGGTSVPSFELLLTGGADVIFSTRGALTSAASNPNGRVVGVDLKLLGARTFAVQPSTPVSTALYPQTVIGATASTPRALTAAVSAALLSSVPTDPGIGSNRLAGWRTPVALTEVEAGQVSLGLASITNNTCVRQTYFNGTSTLDVYSLITCPPGTLKQSRTAVASSCVGVPGAKPCPKAFYCACKPCLAIPAIEFKVSAALGTAAPVACTSTAECLVMSQQDRGTIVIGDNFSPQLRGLLSRPVMSLAYKWALTINEVNDYTVHPYTSLAVAYGNSSSQTWTIPVPTTTAYTYLLNILINGAPCAVCPVFVRVTVPGCGANMVATATGACECDPGFFFRDAQGRCVSLIGVAGGSVGGGTLTFIVLVLLAVWRWHYLATHRMTWLVKASEIMVADPPEILGIGSFGLVIKATYRGADVALKRSRRMLAPAAPAAANSVGGPKRNRGSMSYTQTPRGLAYPSASFSFLAPTGRVAPTPAADAADPESQASSLGTVSLPPASSLTPHARRTIRHLAAARLAQDDLRSFRMGIGERSDGRHLTLTGSGTVMRLPGLGSANASRAAMAALPDGQSSAEAPRSPKSSNSSGWMGAMLEFGRETGSSSSTGGWLRGRGSKSTSSGAGSNGWQAVCGGGQGGARANFMAEISLMMSLRHPKIVTVMGAALEKNNDPILILEFMPRGSLQENLLYNVTSPFDAEVSLPIISDIVSGLSFLHAAEPPVLHADMKSQNVLLDASFRAKIADFGLAAASRDGGPCGTPYWMAPELLRGDPPTTASDVFAFGITLYEMWTRTEPYEADGDDVAAVLEAVADATLWPPKRPWPEEGMPPSVPQVFGDMIRRATHAEPGARPTMAQLATELKYIDGASLGPAFAPRATASSVLDQVFPHRVAKALREGRAVEPEAFETTTIFFSDIVGFTTLSSKMAAEDVMDLLDRLYTTFDDIARAEGLFKVDTIGDAYLCIAGLPEPQVDHCARVARFALAAVAAADTTPVCPRDPSLGFVQIRAGFHSGRCIASVVGKSNPKYTLFGDAVNTASRMESTGVPGRVHLSKDAATLLQEQAPDLAREHLTQRGYTAVKGKGKMLTFFLGQAPQGAATMESIDEATERGAPSPGAPGGSLHGRGSVHGRGAAKPGPINTAPPGSYFGRKMSTGTAQASPHAGYGGGGGATPPPGATPTMLTPTAGPLLSTPRSVPLIATVAEGVMLTLATPNGDKPGDVLTGDAEPGPPVLS